MFQSYIKGSFLSIFHTAFRVDKKTLTVQKLNLTGFASIHSNCVLKKSKMKYFVFFRFSESVRIFCSSERFHFSPIRGEHFFVFFKHIYIKDICNTSVIYLERYIKRLLKHV